jgi:two-component system response regulator AtoC
LFGYERGAFTGAEQKRRGKFQLAHGGVLLLDEIGDMPLALQAKLLHVLQSGEFSPLGSEKDFKTDTWVIAATNHDLTLDISEGRFREDLYYRLNVIKVYIPPLRERPEDILPLIEYYVEDYASQLGGSNIQSPGPDVIERLRTYHWPGNVRELQNVLKRMLVLGHHDRIVDEVFETHTAQSDTGVLSERPGLANAALLVDLKADDPMINGAFSLKTVKKKAVDQVEKEVIAYVLQKTDWNRSKASKILKVSYKTLLNKISDLDITPPS